MAEITPERVETVAKAIYAARPFFMASTATTHGHQLAQTFDWDGAPAYYQHDMRELAHAAITAMLALDPEVVRMRDEIERLKAAEAAREEQGRRELEYYYETTCACTAAERYVPTCPKHGSTEGDR